MSADRPFVQSDNLPINPYAAQEQIQRLRDGITTSRVIRQTVKPYAAPSTLPSLPRSASGSSHPSRFKRGKRATIMVERGQICAAAAFKGYEDGAVYRLLIHADNLLFQNQLLGYRAYQTSIQ
jgi:hypothetical protein